MNKEQEVVKKYLSVCKKKPFQDVSVNLYTGYLCCVLRTSEHLQGTGDGLSVWNSSRVSRQPDWRVTISGHFDTTCILLLYYRFSVKNEINDRRRAVSRISSKSLPTATAVFSRRTHSRFSFRFSLISLAYSSITVTSHERWRIDAYGSDVNCECAVG